MNNIFKSLCDKLDKIIKHKDKNDIPSASEIDNKMNKKLVGYIDKQWNKLQRNINYKIANLDLNDYGIYETITVKELYVENTVYILIKKLKLYEEKGFKVNISLLHDEYYDAIIRIELFWKKIDNNKFNIRYHTEDK